MNAIGIRISEKDIQNIEKFKDFDFIEIKLANFSSTRDFFSDLINPKIFADMVDKAYNMGLLVGVSLPLPVSKFLENQYTMYDVTKLAGVNHPIFKVMLNNFRYKALGFVNFIFSDSSVSQLATDTWTSFVIEDIYKRTIQLIREKYFNPFVLGISTYESFVKNFPSMINFLNNRGDMMVSYSNTQGTLTSLKDVFEIAKNTNFKDNPLWSDKRTRLTMKHFALYQPESNMEKYVVMMYNGTIEQMVADTGAIYKGKKDVVIPNPPENPPPPQPQKPELPKPDNRLDVILQKLEDLDLRTKEIEKILKYHFREYNDNI
jgi:hypothetical protein